MSTTTPRKLQHFAKQTGEELSILIPEYITAFGGVAAAADEMGVTRATIYNWLRENNLKVVKACVYRVVEAE